ncbi:MAG: hypothetical protein ACYTF0_01870 [Planctomycetota bacterium]|jgi:hypothetical protein
MKIRRRARLDHFLEQQKITRDRKGVHKRRERSRRDERMAELLKAQGDLLSPAVASWVASKLGKPATKASSEELAALVG